MTMVFLTGCCTDPQWAVTPGYRPSNFFQEADRLPKEIKRVAVLPLTVSAADSEMDFGRSSLWPVLVEEVGKMRRFEIVTVLPEELRRWTGRAHWSGEEKLPLDFFEKIREALGCDAVLFCMLTLYRGYDPVAIGWRLKLVEADEPHLLWSVDEVFDSRDPAVACAARRYYQAHPDASASLADAHNVMVSPRRFARYASSAALETMPNR